MPKKKQKKETNTYHCSHCGKNIEREGNKQWRKSFCETSGKEARITLVKKTDKKGKK